MTVSRTISYQEHYSTRLHLLNGYNLYGINDLLKYKSREKVLYRNPARFIFTEFVHFWSKFSPGSIRKLKKMKKIYGKKFLF